MKNYNEFLEELAELSNKYKIVIGGCGCCGSPFIYGLNEETDENDKFNLTYNEELKKYEVDDEQC